MFRDYLQFEMRSKNETKSQMECAFPSHHPLHPHRTSIAQEPSPQKKSSSKGKKKSVGGAVAVPRIKEGSARVLTKSKESNPYTGTSNPPVTRLIIFSLSLSAHLRRNKGRQQRTSSHPHPHLAPAVPIRTSVSAFPQLSPSPQESHRNPSTRINEPTTLPVINKRAEAVPTATKENIHQPTAITGTDQRTSMDSASSAPVSPLKEIKSKIQQLENQLQRQRKVLCPLSPPSLLTRLLRILNRIHPQPHARNGLN
jgi:hypothetical protein